MPIDSEARKQNRTLPTPKVLSLLHQQLPAAYRSAEVVGKWVWVTFKEQPAAEIRQQLTQLGFHWNRERQTWQHPCGQLSLSSNTDPQEKYSSSGRRDAGIYWTHCKTCGQLLHYTDDKNAKPQICARRKP